jgi:Holliday junction DNA helicase RuvA
MAILSVLSPAALSTAVLEDDATTLCSVPGVGRKTAARLLIDLKSQLDLPDLSGAGPVAGTGSVASARADIRAALGELGYSAEEIRAVLDGPALDGASEGAGVEELLRLALRALAAR